jgi:hypothetical protein
MYPYRAYIETLLSYGPAAKESQLTGVMWYKDTPGQQDKRTTDNKGFTARKKLTALSKSVQMMGKLHLDLFCQDKYYFSFRLTLTSLNRECIHKSTGPTSVSGSKLEPLVFTICASTNK